MKLFEHTAVIFTVAIIIMAVLETLITMSGHLIVPVVTAQTVAGILIMSIILSLATHKD